MQRPLLIVDFVAPPRLRGFREVLSAARFEDGRVSAGAWAEPAKRNKQAIAEGVAPLADEVVQTLFKHKLVGRHAYPLRTTRPLFNRYVEGDYYRTHEDNPLQSGMRADLSYTLFLSEPDEYDGGALVLDGESFREAAGSLLLYPSGTPHQVDPITRGMRLAAVGWIQSLVRDQERRSLLSGFSAAMTSLRERHGADDPALTELNRVRNQLMRRWAEM